MSRCHLLDGFQINTCYSKLIQQLIILNQMNNLKAFFFVLFTVAIFAAKIDNCPAACDCTVKSLENCRICLSTTYKRNYSIGNNTCPCLEDFQETYPPAAYCVAKNCSLYYERGCYSCNKNWTTQLLDNWYICICKPHYFFDPSSEDCFCNRELQSAYMADYYQPSKYQCLPCPQKCECHQQGCFFCHNQLNRIIAINFQNIYTCHCQPDYQQINGQCILKIQINCNLPRILIDQQCECNDPYYLDQNNDCVCKSLQNPTKYYQYHGVCYICPKNCICSQIGCYHCFDLLIKIYQNHCTCLDYYGVIDFNGRCTCINPWNLETCECASRIAPSNFYEIPSQYTCYQCPTGCICNQTGCIKCNETTNRNNSCHCKYPFTQIDGKCVGCGTNFIYHNNTCMCPNQLFYNKRVFFYLDQDTLTCRACPRDCSCDDSGCYECGQNQFRQITQNSYNIYICDCNTQLKFEENQNSNTCQCVYPYTFNKTSNKCECNQPYYINGSDCLCKSSLNSSEYYDYNFHDCRRCPDQCICTEEGCISCDKNQGRVILISNYTHICPCIPITLNQSSGSCTTCLSNQYIWRNYCLDCDLSCVTCDQNGCLSCSSTLILKDNKCVCTDNDTLNHRFNQNGTCICMIGYFNTALKKCELCPPNCKNCYFLQQATNIVLCSECNANVFRINDPQNNCPCIQNYVQNLFISSYCCHYSCRVCNISGCTQCLPFSYRFMNTTDPNNTICSCMTGFIQNNNSVICTCPFQFYLHLNECLPCPKYCSHCFMPKSTNVISCKCLSGMNRINKQHGIIVNNKSLIYLDCICAEGFVLIENSPYCYSKFCSQYGVNGTCHNCTEDRKLSSDKLYCNCLIGYYQDANKVCQECSQGCDQCLSRYLCQVCQPDFQLISDKELIQAYCIIPKKEDKLLYQFDDYTIFQIKQQDQQFTNFTQINIFINLHNSASSFSFKIKKLQAQMIGDIIIIKFNRFAIPELNSYIIKTSVIKNKENKSYFYLQESPVYTKQQLQYPNIQESFIYLFIFLLMLASLILNIVGVKQNDIMFICQTIYFFAMKVQDPQMLVVRFLNYFKITIFNFSFVRSNSPFDGLLSNWQQYVQYSSGNYKYYNIDSNLLRNAGLVLYLAIQNAFLIIVFRCIYYVLYNMKDRKYRNFGKKYKKPIYRFLEWCYKVFMYPVLFYSLSTVICYKVNYSLINQSFRFLNLVIAIVMIILYTVITILQYLYNQIAKMHKYDYLIEFMFKILISISIVSIPSTSLLVIALLVFVKGCLHFYNYQALVLKKLTLTHKIILMMIVLIQSLIFFPIYYSSIIGTVIVLLISLLCMSGYRIYLYNRILSHFKYDKKNQHNWKEETQYVDSIQNMRVTSDNPGQICVLK